ncbi:hypothetical protein BRARA_D00835 [Brassica rapa]|uniref:Transmembrane protein n=1 Tax=Brassica campestris TaxID=3711 RepID=A0A397ZJ44_BRACM|nr:hypothetical protein BRARA_D00835 [Brassica rapa]
MCSNWLLMKIEEDEGGRPRRIYSIGKRQSHRKSSLRKPMIKVPPLASFICVPSTVPSLLFFIEQRIWKSSDKKIKWKMDIRRKSYTSSNDSVNFCLLGGCFILYLLIERYGNRHRDLVPNGKTVTERYRDEGV